MAAAVSDNDSVNPSWHDMGAEKYNICRYADGKETSMPMRNILTVRTEKI